MEDRHGTAWEQLKQWVVNLAFGVQKLCLPHVIVNVQWPGLPHIKR